MNLDSPFFLWFWVWSACGMRLRSRVYFPWLSSVMRSRAQQSALAAPRNGQRKIRRRTPCLLKCGGLGFQMFFAHPSEPTPSSTFRAFSTAWRTSSLDTFVQIGSHSDGDRFIPVLFFRLRQLPVSSRPFPSDRDSSAEIAPCPASESSSASELILETSLAAAVRVGNAALCSPVLLSARTHRRPQMTPKPKADLLLGRNPG